MALKSIFQHAADNKALSFVDGILNAACQLHRRSWVSGVENPTH